MTEIAKLEATPRESFGKGVARKLRAAGLTPVVVYGNGSEPQHFSVDSHQLGLIVRTFRATIELSVAGATQLVQVKDVQRDPVLQIIEHVDLVLVDAAA